MVTVSLNKADNELITGLLLKYERDLPKGSEEAIIKSRNLRIKIHSAFEKHGSRARRQYNTEGGRLNAN